jgi:hypothetical protein
MKTALLTIYLLGQKLVIKDLESWAIDVVARSISRDSGTVSVAGQKRASTTYSTVCKDDKMYSYGFTELASGCPGAIYCSGVPIRSVHQYLHRPTSMGRDTSELANPRLLNVRYCTPCFDDPDLRTRLTTIHDSQKEHAGTRVRWYFSAKCVDVLLCTRVESTNGSFVTVPYSTPSILPSAPSNSPHVGPVQPDLCAPARH